MKHLKLILLILLGLFLLPEAKAQTDPSTTQTICFGSVKNYRVDWQTLPDLPLTGTPGSTYNWTLSAAVSGTASISTGQGTNNITVNWGATPAGPYTDALSVIETTSSGCVGTVVKLTVIISPVLSATVAAVTPICSGSNAVFTFTGPNNGTINYTLNGTATSVTLDASGNASVTITAPSATQAVVLTNVTSGTCSNVVTGNASVTINPTLTAGVTSASPICSGSNAVFTFTGPNNGSINYTLNGVAASVALNGSGSFILTIPSVTSTQTVLLVDVTSASCTNVVSGTASVSINSVLSATVATVTPICSGSNAVFTFTGPNSGTINYTLNGTASSVTLDATGNATVTITAPSATQAVVLTNVTSGTCSNAVTGNASVTINPTLTAGVTSASPICSGSNAVFTFTGPNNGSINYTLNGVAASVTLNGTGSFTLTIPSVTSTQSVVLTNVTSASCTNVVTGSASVTINSVLSATVAAVTPICSGSNAVFNFTGPNSGAINYTLNGTASSVTLDASGNATVTITAPSATQAVVLTNVTSGTCSNTVTGNASVTINPSLTASVTSASPICSGSNAVFTFTGPNNGSINYTLNGVAASVTLNGTGSFTLTIPSVTSTQSVVLTNVTSASCTNVVTGSASVTINSVLSANVAAVTPICSGSNAVFTFTGPNNGTINYTLNGTASSVTLDASGNATVTITAPSATQAVVLTNVTSGTCSNTVTGNASVTISTTPSTSPIYHD